MSNAFYCQLREIDVTYKDCSRLRKMTADRRIEPCSQCVVADLWMEYQSSLDPVVIELAKQSEPKRGPQPKQEPTPKKSEPIVEASTQKRCECGAILGNGNTTGKCKTCYSREKNYRKGLKCSDCGKPITDYSKTGLCIHCSASRGQKSETVPKTGGETMETIKTHESECVPTEPVETVVQMQLMPPESLGAAKIAIDRAFQDA